MSFHKEDGVSSLCQKALHIVTELCFAGQVEWEKCSGIFPPDRGSQGAGSTGNPGRAPLASSRPAGTPRSPPGAPVPRLPRRGGHLWDHAPSYLAPSFHSAAGDFERGLLGFCLPSTRPAPCTSLVRSLPARAVSLPGARAPSPRSPTPGVSLRSGTASAGSDAGTACPALPAGSACPSLFPWVVDCGRSRAGQSVLEREDSLCKWGCLAFRKQQKSRNG